MKVNNNTVKQLETNNIVFEELEANEEMMSDFWKGYCYGVIVVGGVLIAAT